MTQANFHISRNLLAVLALAVAGLMSACKAGVNNPGRAYAPDMVYSQAYEPYYPGGEFSENGMSARLPDPNAVAYGEYVEDEPIPYPWPFASKDTIGILAAISSMPNPIPVTPEGLQEGKRLYGVYCGICHGAEMDGKGYLVTGTIYGGVPANLVGDERLQNSAEGYFYHVLQHGVGSMGSYAYAMTREQRWQLVSYVKSYQKEYLAEQAAEEVEEDPAEEAEETPADDATASAE